MSKINSLTIRILQLTILLFLLGCSGHNGSLPAETVVQDENAQDPSGQAVITFDSLTHDFGSILEGEKVVCYFDYENSGKKDLWIETVEVTCGCTIPDWSSEPLKPGDRRSLKIIFDATDRSGAQYKVITVKTNASNPVVKLTLIANIET